MLTILLKALDKVTKTLVHEWDQLAKSIGKHTANTLLIYITLATIFEAFWLTLVLTGLLILYVLKR